MSSVGVALFVITLVVGGCAVLVASERPITVTMGPSESIRKICTEAVGQGATGCLIREGDRLVVFCPSNDARCLAQELRRASEPEWNRSIAENSGKVLTPSASPAAYR